MQFETRLKIVTWKKTYQTYNNHKCQTQSKSIKAKESYCIMIKDSMYQEDIIINSSKRTKINGTTEKKLQRKTHLSEQISTNLKEQVTYRSHSLTTMQLS